MTATLERPAPNALLAVQEQPLRVAIYLRMSTDKELGIDRQREDCLALCQRLGWIPVEYVDLDTFGGIPEFVASAGPPPLRLPITPDQIAECVADRLNPLGPVDTGDCSWLPPFCPVSARLAGPDENGVIAPAQLVLLTPDVPSTLVLTSIP